MKSRTVDLADFQGTGILVPDFYKSGYVHFRDNTYIGLENVRGECPITTILHDMIGDDPTGRFIFQVDFRHYASIITDNCFMY